MKNKVIMISSTGNKKKLMELSAENSQNVRCISYTRGHNGVGITNVSAFTEKHFDPWVKFGNEPEVHISNFKEMYDLANFGHIDQLYQLMVGTSEDLI